MTARTGGSGTILVGSGDGAIIAPIVGRATRARRVALARHRVGLRRIEAVLRQGRANLGRGDGAFVGQCLERGHRDRGPIDLEELP